MKTSAKHLRYDLELFIYQHSHEQNLIVSSSQAVVLVNLMIRYRLRPINKIMEFVRNEQVFHSAYFDPEDMGKLEDLVKDGCNYLNNLYYEYYQRVCLYPLHRQIYAQVQKYSAETHRGLSNMEMLAATAVICRMELSDDPYTNSFVTNWLVLLDHDKSNHKESFLEILDRELKHIAIEMVKLFKSTYPWTADKEVSQSIENVDDQISKQLKDCMANYPSISKQEKLAIIKECQEIVKQNFKNQVMSILESA